MKKTVFRIISLALMLCVLLTAFPLSTVALGNDLVEYYTDGAFRTGIKEIYLDPFSYYDCSGNKSAHIDSAYLIETFPKLLTSNDVTVSILKDWGNIAASIFENGGKYTCTDDFAKCYGKDYDDSTDENYYIGELLSTATEKSGGSKGKDYYHSTGLSVANSLNDVRNKMGSEIAGGINRKICSASDILGQGKNCDDALPELKDETNQTVLYNIATSIARSGSTAKVKYNSYGIAFYDFDLMIIADDELEYVTKAESLKGEANPVEAAEQQGMEGFSYTENSDVSYFIGSENYSTIDANKEFSLNNTTTDTISTSLQNSESYSFSQMIGSETEFDSTLSGIIGGVKEIFKVSFTTEQSFGTAFTEENSYSVTTGTTDVISYPVPAQTVAYVEQSHGAASMTVPYDVPVALTFKVMVFCMNGDVYADKVCTLAFSTAGYRQSYFSTVFGSADAEAGTYAYESLYNRYQNKDVTGWDSAKGNNHVYYKKHDGSSEPTDTKDYNLNWSGIESVFKKNRDIDISITDFATRVPMLSSGASTTETSESYSSKIYDYKPMYLPTYVNATNLEGTSFNMLKGGVFNLSGVDIELCNANGVPYYGFKYADGHWELCDDSEDVIQYNSKSNTVIAKGTGVGSIQYVINEDVEYTAEKETGKATTREIAPFTLTFAVFENPLINDASVELKDEESFKGTVGDELVDVSQLLDVVDENGSTIDNCPVIWEAEDNVDGINIENGKVSFTKEGTYKIRAILNPESEGEITTDWIEVTPRQERKLADAELTANDIADIKLAFKYMKNSINSSQIKVNILSYVTCYDQYGDLWKGELPEIDVKVDKETGAYVSEEKILTITKEGVYNITVKVSDLEDKVIGSFKINAKADVQHELGDTDGDSYRTIKDATIIQKYLANLITVEDFYTENADVNEDGKISISDASLIQKYLAKIID